MMNRMDHEKLIELPREYTFLYNINLYEIYIMKKIILIQIINFDIFVKLLIVGNMILRMRE